MPDLLPKEKGETARKRRKIIGPSVTAFYGHYWRCPKCGRRLLCDEGRSLKSEYDLMSDVASVASNPNRSARLNALRDIPAEKQHMVRERVEAIWKQR